MSSTPASAVAIVLWSGDVGGAERFAVQAAREMRRLGVEAEVIFVTSSGRLGEWLHNERIPFRSLDLRRGRDVLLHARSLGKAASSGGASAAWLIAGGYLAAALRLGGFEGRIVATEHGQVLEAPRLPAGRRLIRWLDRASGTWAIDVEVGVSDFVVAELLRYPHARSVVRIYNGVDLSELRPLARAASSPGSESVLRVGAAGRLVRVKQLDHLLTAVASARDGRIELHIAGDGPERSNLEAQAQSLGLAQQVQFHGWVDPISCFWHSCDVAAITSVTESFSMVAAEAMACGLPVVSYENGALPEIIRDAETGRLVQSGDVAALSEALVWYQSRPALRREHGSEARRWCEERYDLRRSVEAYLELLA